MDIPIGEVTFDFETETSNYINNKSVDIDFYPKVLL
jgi:hypothetical protein